MNKRLWMRVLAVCLTVVTLLPLFAVPSSAGDYVMEETLVDEVSYTYVANFVEDNKSNSKQYAYAYMNMAALLGMPFDTDDYDAVSLNPNIPFFLTSSREVNGDTTTNLEYFRQLEGYWKQDGTPIDSDSEKFQAASTTLKLNKEALKKKTYKNGSPLSFPYYSTMTVTAAEKSYAQQIQTSLTSSLNGILFAVNEGSFNSAVELVNKSILIRPDNKRNTVLIPGSTHSGYLIIYADLTGSTIEQEMGAGTALHTVKRADDFKVSNAFLEKSSAEMLGDLRTQGICLPHLNTDNALMCYIIPYDQSPTETTLRIRSTTAYPYAYPKGYTDVVKNGTTVISGKGFPTESGNYSPEKKDYPWITVHMLSAYANTVYKNSGICVENYKEPTSSLSWLTELIGKALTTLLNGLGSLLGLTDMDDLVFNTGTTADNYGLMSEHWWNVVIKYSLIFQTLAWMVLVFGLLRMALNLNLSSINPQKKATLYSLIERFVFAGIGLVILIPAVQFMLECNSAIVELFASQVDAKYALVRPVSWRPILDFFLGFIWLALMFYINFIYIYRSVVTGLLIASGPFFISTVAVSNDPRSTLFSTWVKELMANVFVQSVHAFVLSFLMQLINDGKALSKFAIAFSIIPLTEMFRQLIFSGAGGSIGQFAQNAGTAVTRTATGVAKGVGDFVGKRFAAKADKEDPASSRAMDENSGGSHGGGGGRNQDSGFHSYAKSKQANLARQAAMFRAQGDDKRANAAEAKADLLALADGTVGIGASVLDVGSEIMESTFTGRPSAGLGRSFQNAIGSGGINRLTEDAHTHNTEQKHTEDMMQTANQSGSAADFGGEEASTARKNSASYKTQNYKNRNGQTVAIPNRADGQMGRNVEEVRHNAALDADTVKYGTDFGDIANPPQIAVQSNGDADITYNSLEDFREAMLAIGHRDTAYLTETNAFAQAASSGQSITLAPGNTLSVDNATKHIVQHLSSRDGGYRCSMSHGEYDKHGKPVEKLLVTQAGGRTNAGSHLDIFGAYEPLSDNGQTGGNG